MPATCCVIGCNNRHSSSKNLRFYRIPRGKDQRFKFIKAIAQNRTTAPEFHRSNCWEPNNSTRICSVHFESGSISKNKNNIDYSPTLYMDIGKDNERGNVMNSLQEYALVSTETNETEFRDHITNLIDEASVMLKQREDNHLTQSLLFHDYVVPPHNSRTVPEYDDPDPTLEHEPHHMDSDPDCKIAGGQDTNSSWQDTGGQSLNVVMTMSSTRLQPNEDLEHFWVADTLLRMGGGPTFISSHPDNTLCTTGATTMDALPVTGVNLTAPAVRMVL